MHALTIDLEHWWESEFLKGAEFEKKENIERLVPQLLDILESGGCKATFFVLGTVAERYPDVVRQISSMGHEIACHGYSHSMLGSLGKERFSNELRKATGLLKSASGRRPIGFRAPNFSLNESTAWALDILEKEGYRYDSSVFPISPRMTGMYGLKGAPLEPYRPGKKVGERGSRKLIEFPVSVLSVLGRKFPASGGFFLRALPYHVVAATIKQYEKRGSPANIYLHLRDVFDETPRLDVPLKARVFTYTGIRSARKRLERLVKEFEFTTAERVLRRQK